jgi:hypothetical protein
MLVLILLAVTVPAIFLLGVLVITVIITMRHGDPSACYQLYTIRDRLIDASVFEGVPRDNPWLEALYENVNSILLHSNLLGGPKGWPVAVAVGHYQANNPSVGKKLLPLPKNDGGCPEAIRAIRPDLQAALRHLSCHHLGIYLQIDARERAEKRMQREKAKSLLQMINDRDTCGTFA